MKSFELYNKGNRRWVVFARDPLRPNFVIDTNQYLITQAGKGILLDPGGQEIFPAFVSALAREISLNDIVAIFASHQDPDIISSLALWLDVCTDPPVYVPYIWRTFIPHFGGGERLTSIPDEGMALPLNGTDDLRAVPAHYTHSAGNFSVYDPTAKILFSGDIGGALLPADFTSLFVENFGNHVQYMEGFHKRWMPSNAAKNDWIKRVRMLDVNMMCPQHGAIFKKDDVQRFLDWFEKLEVGSAIAK